MKVLRVFAVLMFCIFFVNMASAFEFDNVKYYDENTRTVTIKNAYGLGDTIGKATLKTPLHMRVSAGYQKVGEMEVSAYQDYNEALKQFTFTDMKKKEKINRDFDIKIKSYKEVDVIDYYWNCSETPESCVYIENGSHKEKREVWTKVTPADLKKNEKVIIGIFTEVKIGDYVDWIPTIYGVEIEEWATWTADLYVDLDTWFSFNETSGTVIDRTGNITTASANNGVTRGVTGINDKSFKFDGLNDYVDSDYTLNIADGDDFFWTFWFNTNDSVSATRDVIKADNGDFVAFELQLTSGDAYIHTRIGGAGVKAVDTGTDVTDGLWHHLLINYDGSGNMEVFLDNVSKGTVDVTGNGAINIPNFFIGCGEFSGACTRNANIQMDEIGFYSRLATREEVSLFYDNASYGDDETPDSPPVVTLISPANLTTYTTLPTVDFTCYGEDDLNFTEMEFYLNGSLTQTNSSGLNATNYIFQETLQDGTHNWSCTGNDNNSQQTSTDTRFVTVDTTPFIEFLTPPTLVNYANITQEYIPMKVNVSTPYFQNITYSLRNVNGTNYTQFYTNQTFDINFTDMPDAHYHYDVTIYTNTSKSNITETRHINHDATPPILTSAINLTNLTTFDMPVNSTWTYNATDPAINTCYYNTTEEASYQVVTCNSTIQTAWTDRGYKTIQYCADDTFGNEQCNTETIFVYWIQDTVGSDRNSVAEGFDVVFNMTVNMTNIPSTTAFLYLNNTVYQPNVTEAGTNGYYFERTVFIPEGWGSSTGAKFEWYWNYTITGEVTNQSSDHVNLTVYTLDIDDCSVYGETILNFTLRDEKTSALINETAGTNVELDVTLQSKIFEDVTLTHSITYTDENNPVACIPSLNESQYWIDITMGYDSTDHVWEFFYLEDGTLNSTKVLDAQTNSSIELYNLETADSTSFLFNFFDLDGLVVDDAIVHVFRQYIGEGTFKEVERAKADQNGETVVHLVEEDVIYYFLITQYGIPYFTSSQYTALCQSTPCEIQIEESGEIASFPTDWDLIDNGGFTISSSAVTREVSLTYQFNETDTINLTVYKFNSDGSYSAINTSGATGTSGVITLGVPQSAGNVSFFASVDQDTDHIKSEWVDFTQKSQDFFGVVLSLFLAGIIILTLALFAVNEGVATIGYVILGIFVSGALGLITTDLSTGVSIVAYLVSAGALLLWKLTRRRP